MKQNSNWSVDKTARGADVAKKQRKKSARASARRQDPDLGKVSSVMARMEAMEAATPHSIEVNRTAGKPASPANPDGPKASSSRKSSNQAIKQELVAPHEWASLLNNIESDPNDTQLGGAVMGEVELASDDLWERLSSTRWIKAPREDFHNDTTVRNRPTPTKNA